MERALKDWLRLDGKLAESVVDELRGTAGHGNVEVLQRERIETTSEEANTLRIST